MMRSLVYIAAFAFLCSIEFVHGGSPFLLQGGPPYLTLPEDYPVGGELFFFYISDSDIGDSITFTADPAIAMYVEIHATPGNNITANVTLKYKLDREDKDRLGFTFFATDKTGNQIRIFKTVYITDVNDNVPEFQNQPYSMDIPELPCNLTTVYTDILATDHDLGENGTVGYKMEATTQSDSWKKEYMATFSIDKTTGHITLKKCLDYETNNYYQFKVTAYDLGIPQKTSFVSLIIRVLDVQDSPPFFTGIPYRAKVNENINKDSSIIAVYARDGDPGISREIEYAIINSTCPWCFAINNTQDQGVITANSTLDRDTGIIEQQSGICILTVQAKEKVEKGVEQNNQTETTTDVTITIDDINDNSPEFAETFYNATVPENTPSNVPLTISPEINVTDIDQGRNARMRFTIQYENGSACTDFKVSPTEIQGSGNIIILVNNPNVLDYEVKQQINISVIATETENTNHSRKTNVWIEISDTNDNNPTFNQTNWVLSVPENSPNGTPIGQITATDKDTQIVNKFIHYSISGGNGRFVVNRTTGEIRTNCSNCSLELDREKQDVYYMTYTAKDGGDRSNSVSLVVTLTDVNDETPMFDRDVYQAFIRENDAKYNSTPVVKFDAKDNDEVGTNNSVILYSIRNTSENTFIHNLTVTDTTGEIFLLSPVDYEKLNNKDGVINITVVAADKGNPQRSSTSIVMLSIQDENDNAPYFIESTYKADVPEDATSNQSHYNTVGNVSATDADVTERNRKLNYFITSGSSDRFTINSTTGVVSVQLNAKLDREQIPLYNLTIIAIDEGSPPLTGTTTMYIRVTDVNDEKPSFIKETFHTEIKENCTEGTFVQNCTAEDPDLNHNLSYSIIDVQAKDENGKDVINSSVSKYFAIYPENGSVYVNGTLDRETASIITLTLLVVDMAAVFPKPQNDTAVFTVTLLDVNDNNPQFLGEPYHVSVVENAAIQSILITVQASDKDLQTSITYEIEYNGSPSTSFSIDSSTGVISKNGSLDREATDAVNLTVVANDNGQPPLTNSTTVFVTITDFNDNAPQFGNFSRTAHVPENSNISVIVLNVFATDLDIGPNKNITYALEDGYDHFEINSTTGDISISESPDREERASYVLKVIAKDNPIDSKEQKSNDTLVTVVIDDINDNYPEFSSRIIKGEILEDAAINTPILTVKATDKDDENSNNSKISYDIDMDSNRDGLFKIIRNTGEILVNASLGDKDGNYLLNVTAYDHGDPSLRNFTIANITVLDKNLHAPVIYNIPTHNLLRIYECARNGSVVHQFNYTDGDHGDNGQASFKILESGTQDTVFSAFNITDDGVLKVIGELDVHKRENYTFQIQASDKGIPSLSSDLVTITVNLIDVNNHDPSFDHTRESWSLRENTTGVHVGTVKAYDQDKEAITCYRFDGDLTWAHSFTIDNITGVVVNTVKLDYEITHEVNLIIKVEDCSKSYNTSGACDVQHLSVIRNASKDINGTININVQIEDINDNPPVFKIKNIATGMRTSTEVNTELQLHLRNGGYITDNDTPRFGELSWTFSNYGNITASQELHEIDTNSGQEPCNDRINHIFCVTPNGTIFSNRYFTKDMSGFFILSVKVSDAGGSDIANITIYLISDSQILTMVIRDNKEAVSRDKDSLLRSLSEILGSYEAVFDSLQDHKENDETSTQSSDLSFHLVNKTSQAVISGPEAERIMDAIARKPEMQQVLNQYHVMGVSQQSAQKALKDNAAERNMYILLAVSVLEAIVISIIIYVFFSNRHKYHRKLKAANIKPTDMELHAVQQNEIAVPGSNMYSKQNNPLLNAQVSAQIAQHDLDSSSVSFDDVNLDENEVGDPQTVYDRMEEKEVTLDMYGDDVPQKAVSSEDLLAGALQSYEIHKSMESLDNLDEDRPAPAYLNPLFHEDLESTEI